MATLIRIDHCSTFFPPSIRKPLSLNGSQARCKTIKEDDLGMYSLFEITVAPQSSPPARIHHWEEKAYFILEGELLIQNGEHTFAATAGSFVDVPNDILHTFKNVGTMPTRMLAIVTPGYYGKFFKEWITQQRSNPRFVWLVRSSGVLGVKLRSKRQNVRNE